MNKLFRLKYAFNAWIRGYVNEAITAFGHVSSRPHFPSTRFLIFTGGRTGSTLLQSLLESHPLIHCDGEILKGKMFDPLRHVERKMERCRLPSYGFKLLSYQLRDVQTGVKDKRRFIQALCEKGFRIIYLERRNKTLQAKSVALAMHADLWHTKGKAPPLRKKVAIPQVELDRITREIQALTAFEKEVLQGSEFLHLYYEDHLMSPSRQQRSMPLIFDWLGVPPHHVETDLRKLRSEKYIRAVPSSQF